MNEFSLVVTVFYKNLSGRKTSTVWTEQFNCELVRMEAGFLLLSERKPNLTAISLDTIDRYTVRRANESE